MEASSGIDRALARLAAVVVLGTIMSILDTTIVNVALETLSRELHSPLSTIQWVSAGYLLALAMVIPLTGWLSERFGARRIWMISVATHWIVDSGALSSRESVSRATLTIVVSRIDMITPTTTTAATTQTSRGSLPLAAECESVLMQRK